jgi:hypothetical protein
MAARTGKTAPGRVTREMRRAQAVAMRRAGHEYSEIGAALGITKAAAYQIVERAMTEARETCKEDAEFLRDVQNRRIEDTLRRIFAKLDPKRRPIPGTGVEPPSADPIDAAHVIVKLLDRQARLNGLDAPAKVAVGAPGAARTGPDGKPMPADPHAFRALAILPQPHEDPDAWAAEYAPTTTNPPTT